MRRCSTGCARTRCFMETAVAIKSATTIATRPLRTTCSAIGQIDRRRYSTPYHCASMMRMTIERTESEPRTPTAPTAALSPPNQGPKRIATGSVAIRPSSSGATAPTGSELMMPEIDGPDVCRRVRAELPLANMYLLLVTAREGRGDVIAGLDAGADDYIIKPFDPDELRARVAVGVRVLGLQQKLAERVAELQDALSNVKQLRGLLPICSYCKRIRGDDQYWQQVEGYIADHSEAQFSHGICPACYATVSAELDEMSRQRGINPDQEPK